MEYQQVLESFDSLWFFATRTPPRTVVSAAVEVPGEEIATPVYLPKSAYFEPNSVNGNGLGSEMGTEEKRRRRRRKTFSFGERNKFEVEMEMGYAVKEICECLLLEQRIGIGNYNYQMKKKMPLFEDSMAMKEHIKSWAYAVACTVR